MSHSETKGYVDWKRLRNASSEQRTKFDTHTKQQVKC
jgi:hypothetical protein